MDQAIDIQFLLEEIDNLQPGSEPTDSINWSLKWSDGYLAHRPLGQGAYHNYTDAIMQTGGAIVEQW